MNTVGSSRQVKYTLEDAMKSPEHAQKISDCVNNKLKEMGYSDRKIQTFLLQKQLKLNRGVDRLDVTLNNRHLFYVVVKEMRAGSYKTYTVDVE